MGRSVTYTCNLLQGSSKKGILPVDDNGYREIVLGGFNMYNAEGRYYPMLESVKELFQPGGSFRRRLDQGQCYGELGHPVMEKGWSVMDYIRRVLLIKSNNVSHHIASVSLEEAKDEHGKSIILSVGRIKPAGPHADALLASLENREENVAFSVRSLASDRVVAGRLEKHVSNLVSYDSVISGGISVATKYNTPTLESLEPEVEITDMMLHEIVNTDTGDVAMESSVEVKQILTDLGWQKIEIVRPDLAKFLKW